MTRIGGTARVLATALALAAATRINAQTFSGDWRVDPTCSAAESGTLPTGCVEESLSRASQCIQCNQVASDGITSWSRTAARGAVAGTVHVEGQQYVTSPCGAAAGGTGNLDQAVRGNDVIFTRISDPNATGLVSVRLNTEFRGHVELLPACTFLYAQVEICTKTNGESCSSGGSLRILSASTGVLAGYPNDMSTLSLTGVARNVNLGVPAYVTLDLKIKAGGLQCESPNLDRVDSLAIGELTLPPSGPVFVLPPDVTVNSAELGIVNNQWVGAAPSVTEPPEPQSVCEGSRADFSVGATGGAGLQYQWRRNGLDVADGPTGTGSTLVGANSATLTVFDVAGADTGSYDCVIGNGCLSTTTTAGVLELVPAVADAGADQNRDELTLVTLDGSASAGQGCTAPPYSWIQVGGAPVILNVADPARPTFVAPEVGPGGELLTFRLDIDDGAGGAVSDTVGVTIVNVSGDVDADGVQDVADCAPLDPRAFAVPGEVSRVAFTFDHELIEWSSIRLAAGLGTVYDVMRGSLSELPVGGGASEFCLASSVVLEEADDAAVPLPGAGFYYLVRARNACGVGSYGTATGGGERIGASCP